MVIRRDMEVLSGPDLIFIVAPVLAFRRFSPVIVQIIVLQTMRFSVPVGCPSWALTLSSLW
jgi:hypothetical protein